MIQSLTLQKLDNIFLFLLILVEKFID